MLQQVCHKTVLIMMLLKGKVQQPKPIDIYACVNRVVNDVWVCVSIGVYAFLHMCICMAMRVCLQHKYH